MWPADGASEGGLAPGSMVGEYCVERLVGEGGMGQVYGAVHPVIGKRAAIKVLLPEICRNRSMVERFVMEARSVNQIGHPNIVDVFAFGALPDGRQYMVMEWLKGEALSDRLSRGIMPLGETCDVLLSIAAALDAAHEKGIIHRDLKPHNVFLVDVKGQKQLVKLLDFGLVKLMGPEDDGRVERTRSGSVLGTPAYMSPEQALGKSVDPKSDNYSLGVMAFQMFTGRLPFTEDNAMALMVAHMQQPPTVPSAVAPNIPPEIDQLVLGLLAKDPAQRPTMSQAMEMLTYVRDMYGGGHRSGSIPPRPMLGAHPSAATIMPPTAGVSTTLGQSQGQLTQRREPPSTKKFIIAGIGVAAAAAIAIGVVAAGRGGDTKTASEKGSAIIETAPADAAMTATTPPPPPPPPPVDAAPILVDAGVPVDAPVLVPVDAGVVKKVPKPPKPPKPNSGSATPQTKPPPDDDDGLIQVNPHKK
jgi:eukaryotic-like serine/threonine-protein kinase